MKPSEVIELAKDETGYLGKKSNSELYDKTANTSGKWNKYAQELFDSGEYYNANKNGYSYCAIFVDWLFYHQAGNNAEEAKKVKPYNIYNPSVYWSYKAYLDAGRTGSEPKEGASIFFKDKKGELWAHTGIVTKVNGTLIETVEGNVSNNVVTKTYSADDPIIICYGYPFYEEEPQSQPTDDWETLATWKDIDGKELRIQKHK